MTTEYDATKTNENILSMARDGISQMRWHNGIAEMEKETFIELMQLGYVVFEVGQTIFIATPNDPDGFKYIVKTLAENT